MKIFLIGYMGSGKTGTGKELSKILKYDFTDTDELVEKKTGKSIREIFETAGQDTFRSMESEALRRLRDKSKVVIATGGGLPVFNGNMQWMNEHGITVYLEANAGLLFHRLAASKKDRPLISGLHEVELMEQISGHLAVRIPIYREADLTVPAADMDVKQLAAKIRALKKKF